MTVFQKPAPARSDQSATAGATTAATRPYLVQGALLASGSALWAAAMVLFGLDPQTRAGVVVYAIASGVFQLGLLALVHVLWRTSALGAGRVARAFLALQAILISLAIGSTIADGAGVSDLSQAGWALLDAFWPFSMLGMFVIGVRIAIAGRWRGVRRFWPMLAESWAVVTIPTMIVFGQAAAQVVAPLHLLVGYATLGVLVATKAR